MKTKIVQTPVYTKTFVDRTVYVTSDEKEFANEREALRHEKNLEILKIKMRRFDSPIFNQMGDTWHYADNEEQLEIIKDNYNGFNFSRCEVNIYGDIRVGEWITVHRLDCGDYPDVISVYTLTYVKEEFTRFLKKLEDK